MRNILLSSVLLLAVEKVSSQSGPWGQCGGTGWTGPVTCTSGYTCTYSNPWYSQCIPGTGSTTTTLSTTASRTTSSTTKISTTASVSSKTTTTTSQSTTISSKTTTASSSKTSSATTTAAGACTAAFTPVTASAAFKALNPGWNLGNTLDATPNEGSWNNPPVTLATIQAIKAKGFSSIRIPVTWAYHFADSSPSWTVNTTFMDRVETVVDQALAQGFYVVLNAHHDSWVWADVSASGANLTLIEEKFGRLWSQIGARFKCKSSKLIFEAINEPSGTTEAHGTELNKLNDIFLTSVNNAGGNNPKRVVSLSGLGMDSIKTSQWFKRGSLYPNQPWGLQFHYYSPYDFIFDAWGRTVWGNDADKAAVNTDFSLFAGNFSGIPTFIGEWDASPQNTEPAARWKYFDYFVRLANQYGFSQIIWDNGLDLYNRDSNTWYDPVAIDILFKSVAGTKNALADSTTDQAATSQTSSAFLFHKVGDPVIAQTVSYTLNGNTLASIKNKAGTTLSSSQASLSSSGVLTLSAAYLGTLYTSTAAAGVKETLTLAFSPGASLTLTIVQYDTPTVSQSTYSLSGLSSDTTIPINYKGLPAIAAVKALKADGTYLVDDWTQYLGPLQQARWTQGNWFWSSSGFILYSAGITTLKGAGQTVTLTLEFYPRSLGQNSVNITFTQ